LTADNSTHKIRTFDSQLVLTHLFL
jgi:hypothetical protein